MAACARCGREAPDEVPFGWMVEREPSGRLSVVCPTCVREHARAIEAKLDQAWW